jgi:hypothetical protein
VGAPSENRGGTSFHGMHPGNNWRARVGLGVRWRRGSRVLPRRAQLCSIFVGQQSRPLSSFNRGPLIEAGGSGPPGGRLK